MGLRGKVALWLALAIIPVALVMGGWRVASEHREFVERRADRLSHRLERKEMRRCERDPQSWMLNRRDLVAFAYDENLVSRNPHAPPIPPIFRSNSAVPGDPVHHWFLPGHRFMGATMIRREETGPCSVVLVGWQQTAAPDLAVRRAFVQTAALAAILAVIGVLMTFPIVARIRRLEEAVRRARTENFELDLRGNDEINHLADVFAETLAALRAREEALEQYIANTTHDLAIPLTVLQHRLRKMSEGTAKSDDVRVALEESHYIGALIANMRTAAKLEAPDALDLSMEVDLSAIVERVIQRHAPIAAQKGIELNHSLPESPLLVPGEPTLTEQALSNLVQNAVQYNTPGGHVSVLLDGTSEVFDLRVMDDGPGIPEGLREAVFERGVRADAARTRNVGGQGFGLSIVRRVCELHGWNLELVHEPGLTVRITNG